MTDESILDRGALQRLDEWGGASLRRKMIEIFLETTPARMAQIRAGIDTDDLKAVEIGAHTLKSSAGNVGAVHLQRAAEEAETLANDEDMEALLTRVPVLEETFGAAQEALKLLLDGMET
ncbi:Hpt domain-containing protein [Gemmatimonadota bacterium]